MVADCSVAKLAIFVLLMKNTRFHERLHYASLLQELERVCVEDWFPLRLEFLPFVLGCRRVMSLLRRLVFKVLTSRDVAVRTDLLFA